MKPKLFVLLLLGICAVLCGVGVAYVMLHQKPAASSAAPGLQYAVKEVKLNGIPYSLQVADTGPKQELGLGRRTNLGPREGMLFTYAQPSDDLCFWMKDMRFSLDIIWLDSSKRVVYVEPSLSPATYPKTYCPGTATQYVIEINAGRAHDLHLIPGTQLAF